MRRHWSNAGIGVVGLIIGFVLISANSRDHSFCQSILSAGSTGCSGVDDRYYAGIVIAVLGGIILLASLIALYSRQSDDVESVAPPSETRPRQTRGLLARNWVLVLLTCVGVVIIIIALGN